MTLFEERLKLPPRPKVSTLPPSVRAACDALHPAIPPKNSNSEPCPKHASSCAQLPAAEGEEGEEGEGGGADELPEEDAPPPAEGEQGEEGEPPEPVLVYEIKRVAAGRVSTRVLVEGLPEVSHEVSLMTYNIASDVVRPLDDRDTEKALDNERRVSDPPNGESSFSGSF